MKSFYLYPGKLAAFKEETLASTLLGSCVSVVLYDPEIKIGGLNHFLLPEPTSFDEPSPRYGTIAINGLIQELERLGAKRNNLKAKVYGGANIIRNILNGPTVGELNIAIAEKKLSHLGIAIVEKNVAGTRARIIKFNSFTFNVDLKISDEKAA